ncbi:hypothetical protein [Mesorhizobium sp. B2-4-17]|uniref:hypothetical protein n=1 Tax=Mesorhizobium sp. B2-4-17 TaxID=2589932 RepID=UPI00112CC4BC|nr:hypothetical protein [Mesorhizobium sp. B2-4-17]TPK89442.1 hypothetical protein FJ548_10105 [Mesorhizobium sp. B2-4-17]
MSTAAKSAKAAGRLGKRRAPTLAMVTNLVLKQADGKHRAQVIGPDGKIKYCSIDPDTGGIDLNDCIGSPD